MITLLYCLVAFIAGVFIGGVGALVFMNAFSEDDYDPYL